MLYGAGGFRDKHKNMKQIITLMDKLRILEAQIEDDYVKSLEKAKPKVKAIRLYNGWLHA
jgi:hypothetical protein